MRFLFVNYEYPPVGGGHGTVSRQYAYELNRLGCEVDVVTVQWGALPKWWQRGGWTVRRLWSPRKKAGQCRPHEMMAWVAIASAFLVTRRGPRPDAVVSFHSIPSGMAGALAALRWKAPHLILFGGGDVPGWLPMDLRLMHAVSLPLNRLIVHSSAATVANSLGLQELAQGSFPKKKIGLLYNSVDPAIYKPDEAARERPAGDPVRLLFAGRLTNQKAPDLLLEALASLPDDAPDWRLDVAGEGPLLPHLKEQARRLGIAGNVNFRGFLGREGVLRLYQSADAFVLPSRFEGMPLVVLEAMACATPVLGTRIMGTEELIREGETGMLVEAEDVPGLRDGLMKMLADGDARRRMGEEARRDVLERWTWRHRAQEFLALAKECGAGDE